MAYAGGVLGIVFLILAIIAFICLILVYFIPTIIACRRNYINKGPVIIINIFLGWTYIGWVIALAWSLKKDVLPPEKSVTPTQISE